MLALEDTSWRDNPASTGFNPDNEIDETRTFNSVNELVSRVDNSVTKSPTYDACGNMTDDGVKYTYEYDAFGRMTKVSTRGGSPATVAEYRYNGLNHRIGWRYDVNASGTVDGSDAWHWFVYDPQWRIVATYRIPTTWTGSADSSPKERFIYRNAGVAGSGSSSYIDEVILRDRDNTGGAAGWDAASDGTLEERAYYLHNWRHDVVALISDQGYVLERTKYSAYGVAFRVLPADVNADGFIDGFDADDYDAFFTGSPADPRADMDYDGFIDGFDRDDFLAHFDNDLTTARGTLSQHNNRKGYAGYEHDPAPQHYVVRHRVYDPLGGYWEERDPLGYHDGAGLYEYVMGNPFTGFDSMGLATSTCGTAACTSQYTSTTWAVQLTSMMDPPAEDPDKWAVEQGLACLRQPDIKDLIDKIRAAGCPMPTFRDGGTLCDKQRIYAFDCCTNTISMCKNIDSPCRAIKHELIHMLDACTGLAPCDKSPGKGCGPENCRVRACTEVRAYAYSGQCCDGRKLNISCLRDKVGRSMFGMGCGDGKRPEDTAQPAITYALRTCLPKADRDGICTAGYPLVPLKPSAPDPAERTIPWWRYYPLTLAGQIM